jgi:hypothetical protein
VVELFLNLDKPQNSMPVPAHERKKNNPKPKGEPQFKI